jgi:Cys-tRNA(Pro)/Cys-tRNA(Cys) deacylase
MAQTRAITTLERDGATFSVHAYDHDPTVQSYGLEAAERLGLARERVFKTLVISLDGLPAIALVPVDRRLDLRLLGKRAAMADRASAERLTGYVVGGISPLGQRRALSTTIDASALAYATIYVSAGRRGLELELAPADLVRLTGAKVRTIAQD